MYTKHILFAFLLGLSALLSAQSTDQARINIRIFPSQVLSIKPTLKSDKTVKTKEQMELTASNLYGYQIKLFSETHSTDSKSEQNKRKENCFPESKLIYSLTTSAIDQKITTQNYIQSQKENINKCITSDTNRMFVYLIVTQ
jgi:hypothetical protein